MDLENPRTALPVGPDRTSISKRFDCLLRPSNIPLPHHSIPGMAGREGLEPPTDGFGDRYSTN